jgi:hypothetical protein
MRTWFSRRRFVWLLAAMLGLLVLVPADRAGVAERVLAAVLLTADRSATASLSPASMSPPPRFGEGDSGPRPSSLSPAPETITGARIGTAKTPSPDAGVADAGTSTADNRGMKSNPHKGAPDAQPKPPPTRRQCPSCGREADALFYPVHPRPGEDPGAKDRPLVCPECCPKPTDETKT